MDLHRGWSWVGAIVLLLAATPRLSAQDCDDESDCAEGQICRQVSVGSVAVPFAPDAGSIEVDAGPPPESEGYCRWPEITCADNGDCPEGLTCDLPNSPCLADAGDCNEDEPGECEYDEIDCEKDTDCAERWECLVTVSEICSTSHCAGEGCGDASAPMCETEESRRCFPKRVDCASDGSCEGDWRCVMFPEDTASDEDTPAQWKGATKVCLPEGIARMVEGELSGRSSASGEASSGGAKGQSETDATGDAPGSGNAADDSGSAADDSGCTVANVGAPATSGAWALGALGALALGLVAVRRRRR